MERVGVIGLGNMGAAISERLLSSGYSLNLFNRTPIFSAIRSNSSVKIADSPAGAAERGGIVLSIVSDDTALRSVGGEDLAQKLGSGGLHISMSTVSPVLATEMEALYARFEANYISAPLLGRPAAVSSGDLRILVAGEGAAKLRAKPLLSCLGSEIADLGSAAAAANVAKLAMNFAVYAGLETIAEASALAENNGLPRAAFLTILANLYSAPVFRGFASRIISGDFEAVEAKVSLVKKDLILSADLSSCSNTPMPFADVLRRRIEMAASGCERDCDATVIARSVARDARLSWGPSKG